MDILREIFDKKGGDKPFDIIGRWRKLDKSQIETLLAWMEEMKNG